MKLLVAIVGRDDAAPVVEAFARERLPATVIETRGGLLREGSAAILAGVDDRLVPRALGLLGRHCRRRTTVMPVEIHGAMQEWSLPDIVPVETGGATVFILPVARFERVP